MTTAEENFLLLERIDADRQFLLLALQSNPALLARADARVREWFCAVPPGLTFPPGGGLPPTGVK
ncbi:hypothetical protein [Thermomonas sp.]|jgi:hypothetical protein|uniref:hypothetical protein n=1 Tax=Thermomonas sp. TaxID=1971895 RepID=UPI002607FB71|nr:hypothetical protein [Thermomonas sp.]